MLVSILGYGVTEYFWIQNLFCKDLEEAKQYAEETARANSFKLKVAVSEVIQSASSLNNIVYSPKILHVVEVKH